MEFLISLLPTFEHLGIFGYWVILLASLAEALAFVGTFVPGGMVVVFFGFLSAQGYLDIGDLIWFAAIGAILGDGISYWLGTKGICFFKDENKILKLSHLTKAEVFFKKHGTKSILLGRFFSPARAIVPFVAGLSRMNKWQFIFWNVVSGFLWSMSYLLPVYFLGKTTNNIGIWSSRIEFLLFTIIVLFIIFWLFIKKGKYIFLFIFSILISIKNSIATNPEIKGIIKKYPKLTSFFRKRLSIEHFDGLPLTFLTIAFIYVLSSFWGIAEDIINASPIIDSDTRVANLFFVFRNEELISFFSWITLIGNWQMIVVGVIVVSVILWIYRKKIFILPFWITLLLAETINFLGKISFHRARPEVAHYIESGFSFPSGHATISVAFFGFIAYILLQRNRKWEQNVVILLGSLFIIIAIGLSRLYLNVHYVSDVWSGYLSGLLALIIGITLTEWARTKKGKWVYHTASKKNKKKSILLILGYISFYIVFATQYNFSINPKENELNTISDNPLSLLQDGTLPAFTETLLGNNQEPLSFLLIAKDDNDLIKSFYVAGWDTAERASMKTLLISAKSALLNRSYPTAPITPSFWNTTVNDFGFEKETEIKNIRERHHGRFWKTGVTTIDGKNIYVGTVSFDTGLKWFVTHKISPDIDTERELLFSDIEKSGLIENSSKEFLVTPTLGENFSGDQFFTDGKIYSIILK